MVCITQLMWHPVVVSGQWCMCQQVAGLLSMCCIVVSAVVPACMCVSISCASRVAPCSLYALCMLHVDFLVCLQVPLLTEKSKGGSPSCSGGTWIWGPGVIVVMAGPFIGPHCNEQRTKNAQLEQLELVRIWVGTVAVDTWPVCHVVLPRFESVSSCRRFDSWLRHERAVRGFRRFAACPDRRTSGGLPLCRQKRPVNHRGNGTDASGPRSGLTP